MCIICVSEKGVRQPNMNEINNMWMRNPHGAGYMSIKNGMVEIHKGFMNKQDFMTAINSEGFTKDDVVVYHFRIATQGGVNPQMTHPFPFTNELVKMKALDVRSQLGIAHNGIIPITSTGDKEYSDTALFIADYLTKYIKTRKDLSDKKVLSEIKDLLHSKMVILANTGEVIRLGTFIRTNDGLLFSNDGFKGYDYWMHEQADKYKYAFY